MTPLVGKILFNLAVIMVLMDLVALPFLEWDSAEFVVAIIALMILLALITFVVVAVRRSVGNGMLTNLSFKLPLFS